MGRLVRALEKPLAYSIAAVLIVLPAMVLGVDQGNLSTSTRPGYDFFAYYRAGRAILDGVSPYIADTLAGPFSLTVSWYLYPPPFAVAFAPLSLLPPLVANTIWTLLHAAAMLLAGATIAGAGEPRRADTSIAVAIGLALGLSTPGFSGIAAGNVSDLLGVLSLAPLVATRRDGLAGVATAVGALAKAQPAIWGAYLAGARRFRPLLIGVGTGLAVMAVTYLLPGVRAGWPEYFVVLRNAAASERVAEGYLGGNLSVAGVLGLAPATAQVVEFCLLATAMVLMLLAGWLGVRFAPLAATVAMFSTPSMWLHSCMLVVPAALVVVAVGPGVGSRRLSGVRLAEVLAVAFLIVSYVCLLFELDRVAAYLLVPPLALAALLFGPPKQVQVPMAGEG